MIIAAIVGALIGIIFFHIVKFRQWCLKVDAALVDIPSLGPPHWLLGNLSLIRSEGGLQQARTKAFQRLQVDNIKVYLGPMPILVTRDIDFFKHIHANQTGSAHPYVRVDTPLLNRVAGRASLLTTDGNVWQNHRKTLNPLFKHQNVANVYSAVVEHSQRLVSLWKELCVVNPLTKKADIVIDDKLKELSTGIIAHLAFSADVGALLNHEPFPMVERFKKISDALEVLMLLPPFMQKFPLFPARRVLEQAINEADQEMLTAIETRRLDVSHRAGKHEDLLDLLLNETLQPPYSNISIRDNCFTLYWAGQETAALFMSWACYYMAKHGDIQQRLYETLCDLPEELSHDDINRIPLLTNILNETLRIASVTPSTLKRSSSDATRYEKLHLPSGLWILMSIYDIHHHDKYWKNPSQFDPDRWDGLSERNLDAFIPFTKGEKACIGAKLGLMEGKVVLANVIKNFEMSLCPGHDYTPKRLYVVRPGNGMKLRMRQRK